MSRIMDIYKKLNNTDKNSLSAGDIGEQLNIDRSTASRYLNDLVKAEKVIKLPGKPVKYKIKTSSSNKASETDVIGAGDSLQPILETGTAAFLYPSRPLPILLTGETGTGKSYLAEKLSNMAIEKSTERKEVPFIAFNCADYAQNAELLVGQIFGIKEGAFTGATEDKKGLVEQADGGILFLDEIHRLPPSGQEMLFYLIDKGVYRRLGEATQERTANIALIGATTEDSESYLLPTLLRRFSVKLNVPPLRERTISEREALIEHFLAEEAAKMNTNLSIEDACRNEFLTYDCPGNIGQLKSDIQIVCARAYLRYLNKEEENVLIKMEDFPGNSTALVHQETDEQKAVQLIEAKESDQKSFPNIYQRLDKGSQQNGSDRLQSVVLNYIQDLTQKYQHSGSLQQGWKQLIEEDLYRALQNAAKQLKDIMPINIHENQLYVIGLHLQNYRNHLKNNVDKAPIPEMIHPNMAYRQAASQLAAHLQKTIELDLPKSEIELIAHFLTPEQNYKQASEQTIAVILVTHGKSTASSMAEVTNYLLGNNVIHAIDMPLDIAAADTYERVKEKVIGLNHIKGALLLVDIGSLITMGDTIQHELDVPIKTLSSVNLPMVLEAGRKSLVSDQTLDDIYYESKKAMFTFMEKEQESANIKKKRLIATVCFTGEGAAQLLESWIENQLSTLDQDVLIRSVRIDPNTKDTSILKDLKSYYEVIAIIGTVPVSIDGIPYIPAWELLQQEGISRMLKLLEITRQSTIPNVEKNVSSEEIYDLIVQGLGEIVTYINPKTIAGILNEFIPPIRHYYGWDTNRELGMWMHLSVLIDRIISVNVKGTNEQYISSIPLDNTTAITDKEDKLWSPLYNKIEEVFQIELVSEIRKELVKLSH
ncbi:sigma 54 modulation protein [Virgibacillus subterraneus]|uniref:Sigma 54 modulation protein n=1 Tax=Virgibacillus subterraneus TaxID=621109 RepID=A0A1H9BAF2_9BACI|nr:sigma-54-dependent transcriptional regulator [Virgibacillus subterraneus]SEP86000.1 sigma 54 modulation protein [Virgibacillus subterraneus]